MKTHVVLAMHGSPPIDFPKAELAEFFKLHAQMEHLSDKEPAPFKQRFLELDRKLRSWPRNPKNDPFFTGAQNMASNLRRSIGLEVVVGFNEFCAPSLDQAIDEVATKGARKIIVITPMMTRGGEHSERDIPHTINRSRKRHPEIEIIYAWPFEGSDVADFLSYQIKKFI